MIRFFLLSRFVLALSAAAAIVPSVHGDEVDSAERLRLRLAETVGFVESALVEPMPDLEERARKGYARDKLMYGLAIKAGRMGAGQEKNAKKWIGKATKSIDSRSYFKSPSNVGTAAAPARDLEAKSYLNGVGQAIPVITSGREPQAFAGPTYLTYMNPDTILIAEACVEALLIAPDPTANVFACGGETEYRRLLALMPK